MKIRGYYAILDATPALLEDDAALLAQARLLLAGSPCCLQLRAKTSGARAMLRAARRLLPLCREHRVPFCVNDRLDVAVAAGADVVHLGQDDLPLADALRLRAELGRPELVVGFSTHNAEQARAAAAEGADYIGFGPVFATTSKLNPDPTVGVEALAAVCREVAVPVVAIGGIRLDARARRGAGGRGGRRPDLGRRRRARRGRGGPPGKRRVRGLRDARQISAATTAPAEASACAMANCDRARPGFLTLVMAVWVSSCGSGGSGCRRRRGNGGGGSRGRRGRGFRGARRR